MSAKANPNDKYSTPFINEWRCYLEKVWNHNKTLYDESNLVNAMNSIDINLKILGNINAINYYPGAITNIYKSMSCIGDVRICRPKNPIHEYDLYPLVLFSVINAYIKIWNLDSNYLRNSTYAKDIKCDPSDANMLKMHAYWKCTTHVMLICYNIIRLDPRLLEHQNVCGKTIINIVKEQSIQSYKFAESQLCEFFRQIEDLIRF
jgi:hypothetical protein